MSSDTSVPSVHTAIAAVIGDLPAIGKDDRITTGPQKYAYRGIETIKAELKPVLSRHGIHYSPHRVRSVSDGTYETTGGATWQRCRLVVRFRIYGPDGSFIEAEGRGEGADNSDKAMSKAMTNAEKQILLQVFCIADSEDPDHNRAPEAAPPAPTSSPGFTMAQAKGRVFEELKPTLGDVEARAKAAVLWQNHGPKTDGPFGEAELEEVLNAVDHAIAVADR